MFAPSTKNSNQQKIVILISFPYRDKRILWRICQNSLLRCESAKNINLAFIHCENMVYTLLSGIFSITKNFIFFSFLIHSMSMVHFFFLQEHFLPSGDHVRVVRMLVKHLHFFSCSALNEVVSSPYQQASRTALDDFKRWAHLTFII